MPWCCSKNVSSLHYKLIPSFIEHSRRMGLADRKNPLIHLPKLAYGGWCALSALSNFHSFLSKKRNNWRRDGNFATLAYRLATLVGKKSSFSKQQTAILAEIAPK